MRWGGGMRECCDCENEFEKSQQPWAERRKHATETKGKATISAHASLARLDGNAHQYAPPSKVRKL